MPTTTELATRVAKRLGILDPSESLTGQEATDITATMNAVYDSLKERGHINWTLTSIPTRYQNAFINLIAYHAAPDFGVSSQEIFIRGNEGLREIVALNERRVDNRTNPVTDF